MNIKEVIHLSNILNLQNRLKFYYYVIVAIFIKIFGLKWNQTLRLKVSGLIYEVSIGKGELDIIYHTNIKKDYMQLKDFIPSSEAVCIDIGANIGSTSLIWAEKIDGGKIFALEPHPMTYRLLKKNIKINNAANKIFPRQLAVGRYNGDMVLFISDEGTMAMKPANYKWAGRKITVPSMTLDSFIKFEKIDMVDILKVDIEGYEAEALEGAGKTLEKTKLVVLEYHSEELRKRCLEILKQNGFESHEKGSLIFSWKN
jgi:FkbM family methyltransferase